MGRSTGPAALIRAAGPADTEAVVDTLAKAFQDDPVTAWVFPGAQRRRAQLPGFFGKVVDEILERGEICLADTGAGALLFAPPGAAYPAPDRRHDREQQHNHEQRTPAPTLSREPTDRSTLISDVLAVHRPHHRAHYYIVFNAVRPDRQGAGLGSAMVRHIVARADADHVGAYVECSNEGSLRLMLRHGFQPLPSIPLPDGPLLHPAWWEPGANDKTGGKVPWTV